MSLILVQILNGLQYGLLPTSPESEATQSHNPALDCFVAALLAMTALRASPRYAILQPVVSSASISAATPRYLFSPLRSSRR